ncbi:hypothetical protein FA95DRAFT_519014 [Auriscalpium vulgare]|uniref:Uncharacterized protein n=1 Tax=Auriscalpium vulgare TaxID=40419 RepID=A0ACB8S401_9AGAM|nr:hypothetical protein FA95DRAFT_519014 [Auriscalpium vulgare]
MSSSLRVAGTPGRQSLPRSPTSGPRAQRQKIAEDTLAALEAGSYTHNGLTYPLHIPSTLYFAPDSLLSAWRSLKTSQTSAPAKIRLQETTTLGAARSLHEELNPATSPPVNPTRVGVLNFASAKKPGGGFRSGAQAQEESIARSSALYPSLISTKGKPFYVANDKAARDGYYTHAVLYSSGVTVFRDDAGAWIPPYAIDVLTVPAVNAGDVRKKKRPQSDDETRALETDITRVMRERMGRLLFLFEQQGMRHIVLGSFGTGVFQNDVGTVANVWFDLLSAPGARFQHSFDEVVMAIYGRETFEMFQTVFDSRMGVVSQLPPS